LAPHQDGVSETDYQAHCLALGVPDPAADLLVEKDFIMEGLFDELKGLDHHKGCYVGQEMTSRMKRRTSVKNKLCRVRFDGPAPAFETPILADGWEVGRMRTGLAGVGIAMIRFDRARKAISDGQALMAGEVVLTLDPPDWLVQPEA
jgi:tRNA-modifying protein YgfZ